MSQTVPVHPCEYSPEVLHVPQSRQTRGTDILEWDVAVPVVLQADSRKVRSGRLATCPVERGLKEHVCDMCHEHLFGRGGINGLWIKVDQCVTSRLAAASKREKMNPLSIPMSAWPETVWLAFDRVATIQIANRARRMKPIAHPATYRAKIRSNLARDHRDIIVALLATRNTVTVDDVLHVIGW